MRKVMPAEFPGPRDCIVHIAGETNREVNPSGPCDERIGAEGKGITLFFACQKMQDFGSSFHCEESRAKLCKKLHCESGPCATTLRCS